MQEPWLPACCEGEMFLQIHANPFFSSCISSQHHFPASAVTALWMGISFFRMQPQLNGSWAFLLFLTIFCDHNTLSHLFLFLLFALYVECCSSQPFLASQSYFFPPYWSAATTTPLLLPIPSLLSMLTTTSSARRG